jgi:hypothetical protein
MKNFNISNTKWAIILAYIILIFFYLLYVVQPELYYHLQQPGFNSNWYFFKEFYIYPGGIAQYLANFLSQFFIFRWTGSLIIICISISLMSFFYKILNSYKKSNFKFIWMFIPFVISIALMNDYNFPFVAVIKLLFVFISINIFNYAIIKKFNHYTVYLILSPIIYYLTGSGFFLIFSISAIISALILYNNMRSNLLFIITSLLYTIIIDYVSFKFIFNISPANTYFSFLPDDFAIYFKYEPGYLFYIFCYTLPIMALIYFIYFRIIIKSTDSISANFKGSSNLLITSILSIFLVLVSVLLHYITYNQHKKNVILADYYCYNNDWDKTISLAKSDPQYDLFINFNYNRAIDNSGHYLDSFFDYPQKVGMEILNPDKINVPQLAMITSDYYYDLGYVSEAQHWAYEAQTSNPYDVRVLKRLVITNFIYNNIIGAKKYLNLLKGNLFTGDFVNKYMAYINDTSLITKDKEISEKRLIMPITGTLSKSLTIRFNELINKDGNNKQAFEHLQVSYLLDSKLEPFMHNLIQATKFYTNLPKLYEQAILSYIYVTDPRLLDNFKISRESFDTFSDFVKILQSSNHNLKLAKASLDKYKNTYMYYVMFLSPKVTKVVLIKRGDPNL